MHSTMRAALLAGAIVASAAQELKIETFYNKKCTGAVVMSETVEFKSGCNKASELSKPPAGYCDWGCPERFINDGECDRSCYFAKNCNQDGRDCQGRDMPDADRWREEYGMYGFGSGSDLGRLGLLSVPWYGSVEIVADGPADIQLKFFEDESCRTAIYMSSLPQGQSDPSRDDFLGENGANCMEVTIDPSKEKGLMEGGKFDVSLEAFSKRDCSGEIYMGETVQVKQGCNLAKDLYQPPQGYCDKGCPEDWINDDECDRACFASDKCNNDGRDCSGKSSDFDPWGFGSGSAYGFYGFGSGSDMSGLLSGSWYRSVFVQIDASAVHLTFSMDNTCDKAVYDMSYSLGQTAISGKDYDYTFDGTGAECLSVKVQTVEQAKSANTSPAARQGPMQTLLGFC